MKGLKTVPPNATTLMWKHLIGIVAATTVWWMAFWKYLGQDFNLFARQVLPLPIGVVLILTFVLGGLTLLIVRIVRKERFSKGALVLWGFWLAASVGFTTLMLLTSG